MQLIQGVLANVLFCLVLLIVSSNNLISHNQGINFLDKSWKEVLTQAEKTDQPILLYFHASWCQPCRRMERRVLSKNKTGQFYNKHFLNFSVDVDKETGKRLADEYGYRAVPAFLYLNPKGQVMDATTGFQKRKKFIEEGREALGTYKSLPERYRAFQQGEMSLDSLYNLAFLLHEINDDRQREVADAYFDRIEADDLHQEKHWRMFTTFTTDINATFYQYVIDHPKQFYRTYKKRQVKQELTSIALDQVGDAAENNDKALLKQILAILEHFSPTGKSSKPSENRQYALAQKRYYEMTGNWSSYAKAASTYVEDHEFRLLEFYLDYATDEDRSAKRKATREEITLGMTKGIVSVADTFYAHIDDEAYLQQATEWVSRTIHTLDTIERLDVPVPCDYHLTHAKLLSKQRRKAEAESAAKQAIKAAGNQSKKCKKEALQLLDE